MNGKVGMTLGIGVGVAAIGGLLYLAFAPVDDADALSELRRESAERTTSAKKMKKSRAPKWSAAKEESSRTVLADQDERPRMTPHRDWFADLPSAKDRDLAKRIQDAQDGDDRNVVFAVADEALSCDNVQVRQAAVEALSLQEGEDVMPVLLKFVGDSDKSVADSAYHAWDDAVDRVEDDLRKAWAVKRALKFVQDEDHVKAAVGKIESLDQSRAIRELTNVIRDGGPAAEAAKESYENLVGEPFDSVGAALLKAMVIDHDNQSYEAEFTE